MINAFSTNCSRIVKYLPTGYCFFRNRFGSGYCLFTSLCFSCVKSYLFTRCNPYALKVLTFMELANRENITLLFCLNFSFVLFSFSLVGIIWNKRNLLIMILCIELMFFSVALQFIFFSIYTYNEIGHVFALFIITTAASETAIGLSVLTLAYRLSNNVSYSVLITLRG